MNTGFQLDSEHKKVIRADSPSRNVALRSVFRILMGVLHESWKVFLPVEAWICGLDVLKEVIENRMRNSHS